MIEAQRYPEDFDGLIIGAPVFAVTRITSRDVWKAQQQLGAGYVPPAKLPMLADAVYKNCDGIDGLIDGLIDDPRKCTFNALTDLKACPGDVNSPDWFTLAQRTTIKNLYDGPGSLAGPYPQYTQGDAMGSEVVYGG